MLTIEKVREIGIPERYISVTRKDFPVSSQILINVPEWLANGDLVIFKGIKSGEFLAVLAKYIAGEFGKLVRWVDYMRLQHSYTEFTDEGERLFFYYSAVPVLIVLDIGVLDKNQFFDIEGFLKQRWLQKLPTFCSLKEYFVSFKIPFKLFEIGEK